MGDIELLKAPKWAKAIGKTGQGKYAFLGDDRYQYIEGIKRGKVYSLAKDGGLTMSRSDFLLVSTLTQCNHECCRLSELSLIESKRDNQIKAMREVVASITDSIAEELYEAGFRLNLDDNQ